MKLITTMLIVMALVTLMFSCQRMALMSTASKKASPAPTDRQKLANDYFWKQFHAGNYDSIPQVLSKLTGSYIENPNDFFTTAHLAWTHMWKVSERNRQQPLLPGITDHIVLSKKYFIEANKLLDNDPRVHGFLASAYLLEGRVDKDQKKTVEGYFMMKKAIKEWPEFNYFTGGFTLSSLPSSDKRYAEAMEWQWKDLDACICEKLDRENPDYSKYMPMETTEGKKRVCWNSKIAPHNFEGFFLNMGDMLVKSGDWKTAVKIYNNAKLSKTYNAWPYNKMLEDRIQNAEANVAYFNQSTYNGDDRTIMISSTFSCMGCHME